MSNLLIHKDDHAWFHIDSDTPTIPLFLGDFYVDIEQDLFQLKRYSGSQGERYQYSNVTIKVNSGSVETFGSISDLINRLIELEYPGIKSQIQPLTTPIIIEEEGRKAVLKWDWTRINNNFDVNPSSPTFGDGKNDMIDWRIDLDIMGRVSVGWNPNDPLFDTIDTQGGYRNTVLPAHEHDSAVLSNGKKGVNDLGTGTTGLGYTLVSGNATGKVDKTSKVGQNVNGVPDNTETGEDKNFQPYIVELHIVRKKDFIVNGVGKPTPTLAQVLTQGGRDLDGFISSDYTVQPSDKSKFREVLTGGSDITLTLDDSTWLPSDNVAGATFIFRNANALDVADKVILAKASVVTWDVCGLGGLMNEIEIPAGYIAQITYAALGFNVILLSAKTEDKLEFQITQSGTDEPVVVSGSMIGNKGVGYSRFYDDVGISHITFDEPILANVKDCYKGVFNKTSIFTTGASGAFIVIVSYYVSDDYTINFEYFTFDFGSAVAADGVILDPVKITIEFKP